MIEYAVQTRTFVDGDFDRTETRQMGTGRVGTPHTLETATEQVERWNNSTYYPGVIRARLVSREVSEWAPVNSDPLDPEPWTVHSADDGVFRFASEQECWAGYRANFEPREGYEQDRENYRLDQRN
jgi:hypothetical protein